MRSNLDVWTIQEKKDETRIALENVDKDYEGNILYLNCLCRFKIGEKIITDKVFSSCFYSEESDTVILFDNGMISEEEIESYLKEFDIKYTTIRFCENKREINTDEKTPEIWFVREKYVLKDAIDDSVDKNNATCDYYPDIESKLSLGYFTTNGEFAEIEGRLLKGLVVFEDKIALLVNQKDPRNLNQNQVEKILNENGIKYKIKTSKVLKRK